MPSSGSLGRKVASVSTMECMSHSKLSSKYTKVNGKTYWLQPALAQLPSSFHSNHCCWLHCQQCAVLGTAPKDPWMHQLFHYISHGGWFIGCSKAVWLFICFQWDSNSDSWGVMSSRCLVLPWVSVPQHQTRRVRFSASFFHNKIRLKETTGSIQRDDKKRKASPAAACTV